MSSCKNSKQARVAYKFAGQAYIMNLITMEQFLYIEKQYIEF